MDDGESGSTLEPAAYEYCRERFHKYLAEYHLDDVMAILRHPPAPKHHVVAADFAVLYSASQKLGSLLVDYPLPFFELFSSVLVDMQEQIMKVREEARREGGEKEEEMMSVKRKCKVRIVNFAQIGWTPPGGRLPASQDVSRLVVVRATVMRAGVAKMLEFRREMVCGSCKHRWETEADPLQYYAFPKEYRCPSGTVPQCDSRKIAPVEGSGERRDYQEIKIQVRERGVSEEEGIGVSLSMDYFSVLLCVCLILLNAFRTKEQIQKLECGAVPRSMLVVLEDDLVDCCQAGSGDTHFLLFV